MLCLQCKKNQATKTYEQIKNGVKNTEYYCLDCYHRLFLCQQEAEGEEMLSACPYCGVTAQEFERTKMVGCAYCYRMMENVVLPAIVKMQGAKGHVGKFPTIEEGLEPLLPSEKAKTEALKKTKFRRQCRELEMIIEKLQKDGDETGAKDYQDKLNRMKKKSAIEEDFVWRETHATK